MKAVFESPFPPDECLARIAESADADGFFKADGTRPVIARVRGNGARLRKRRAYGHSFAPFLFCRVVPHERGSEVRCRSRVLLFPKMFATLWLGLIAVAFLVAVALNVRYLMGDYPASESNPLIFLGAISLMLAFGIGLVWSGLRLGKREMPILLHHVQDVVGSTPTEGGARAAGETSASVPEAARALPEVLYHVAMVGAALGVALHVLALLGVDTHGVEWSFHGAAVVAGVAVLFTIARRAEGVGILDHSELQKRLFDRFPASMRVGLRVVQVYVFGLMAWAFVGGAPPELLFTVVPAVFFAMTALLVRSWNGVVDETPES